MARIEEDIGNIPERTAVKVKGVIDASVNEGVKAVKDHVDKKLAPLMKMLGSNPNETFAEAKARNRLELEAIRVMEEGRKEDVKREAAAAKQEAAAAKQEAAVKKEEAKQEAAAAKAATAKGKAKAKAKGMCRDINHTQAMSNALTHMD